MLHIYAKIYYLCYSLSYDCTWLLLSEVKIGQPKRVFWANFLLFDPGFKARKLFKKLYFQLHDHMC